MERALPRRRLGGAFSGAARGKQRPTKDLEATHVTHDTRDGRLALGRVEPLGLTQSVTQAQAGALYCDVQGPGKQQRERQSGGEDPERLLPPGG